MVDIKYLPADLPTYIEKIFDDGRMVIMPKCWRPLQLSAGCELYLVEFPKVLFAGLYNCLECLQNMKDSDFAFSKYVAPQMDVEEALLARPRAGSGL
jgi:hypothetical protein